MSQNSELAKRNKIQFAFKLGWACKSAQGLIERTMVLEKQHITVSMIYLLPAPSAQIEFIKMYCNDQFEPGCKKLKIAG